MTGSAAVDLVWARDQLLASTPDGPRNGNRRSPAELRSALTDLHDFWLASRAHESGIPRTGGIALLAGGALGRGELVPHSDLDLAVVYRPRVARPAELERLAEQLWYPLWDAGISLDHSVRTVEETVRVVATDLRTATALLDARCLAGDAELATELRAAVRGNWRATARQRIDEILAQARQRWARCGEVASTVEPDLKHGRGGLRDLQILDALAAAQLVDRPGAELVAARKLLLDTRTELRRRVARPTDLLPAQYAEEIAPVLGYADRFALARALSGAGRAVAYAVDVALRASGAETKRTRFGLLRKGIVRRPLAEGVVLHGSEVVLARDTKPGRDPALLLRVASAAAKGHHPIAAGTLARLADSAPELRGPWSAEARAELIALLGAGEGLVDVVEALDRTGLWARLFPEWGAIRDLSPAESVHTWTVDRHLVHTCVFATRLTTRVARPDLLLLAALLHDIGKGRDREHAGVGAELSVHIGNRLGLPSADVHTLSQVVQHHLLLPRIATRRDPHDPVTVHRVVTALEGDPVRLEILHALAEADARATAPAMWKDWHAVLLAELTRVLRLAMAGEPVPRAGRLDGSARELAERVASSGQPEVAVAVDGRVATVTMLASHRTGLLALATGVLALHSLEVHAAEQVTFRGPTEVFVGVFTVSPRFGSLPQVSLLREQFGRAVDGSLPLAERLAVKEREYARAVGENPPARLRWFDSETGPESVLFELRAQDRLGLLHRVAEALDACGVRVRWARATTMGGIAIDSFGLASEGLAVHAPGWRARIESAVLRSAD
ncbi:UTP--GlnB (protein PII) uridylyltransferase GlnD [Tamaricihabitans halophyticus]|uniref:Bifunctional uridylyltransferase/uridylyl-removing enzyme n=1 Tax=Tamaricihabitans halophyticus TaxID=1262583 RepID=A0A4R2QQH2_9PSEU|nr:[protein-PII] uridylyltransferase [Tamaricihabitans halophyticus]TCP51993.1 UTP--GlnB (protein PII) uridylyltransferase GlnD [Tamaricihabitans halophyticus]